MGDFTKLKVWEQSKDLSVRIYKITNNGLIGKDFELKNQMRRSAISIPSNIAEGEESGTNAQSIRYFNIAKGSSAELRTQIIIAKEISYIEESEFQVLQSELIIISKMLTNLIKTRKNTISKF